MSTTHQFITQFLELRKGLGMSAVDHTWKTITLGQFPSPEAYRIALTANGCKIDAYASRILDKVVIAQATTDVELVRVTPAGLGFMNGAAYIDICEMAKSFFGLDRCPAEVGPRLCIDYRPDQYEGERVLVAMEPISASGGESSIFDVSRGPRLSTSCGFPSLSWPCDALFVFVRGKSDGYRVAVDYDQTLDQMVVAGHYDQEKGKRDLKSVFNTKNFPIPPSKRGKEEVVIRLVHFNRDIGSDDVLRRLHKIGLRPAELPELLAFGAAYPKKQYEFPIVALGSLCRSWFLGDSVAFLSGDPGKRYLGLSQLSGIWNSRYWFAAVRK